MKNLKQNIDILTNIFSFFNKDTKQIGIIRNVSNLWNNIILEMIENSNNNVLKNKFIFTETLYIYFNDELLNNPKKDIILNKIKNWYLLPKSILNQIKNIQIECYSFYIRLKIILDLIQEQIIYFLNKESYFKYDEEKKEENEKKIVRGFLKNVDSLKINVKYFNINTIFIFKKDYFKKSLKKKGEFVNICKKMVDFCIFSSSKISIIK